MESPTGDDELGPIRVMGRALSVGAILIALLFSTLIVGHGVSEGSFMACARALEPSREHERTAEDPGRSIAPDIDLVPPRLHCTYRPHESSGRPSVTTTHPLPPLWAPFLWGLIVGWGVFFAALLVVSLRPHLWRWVDRFGLLTAILVWVGIAQLLAR